MTIEITTARLRLCEPHDRHIDQLPAVLNDPDIEANTLTIPYPYTRDDAVTSLERFRQWHTDDAGFLRVIELRESGDLIGTIGFEFLNAKQRGELGYVIGRPWWGQGFATEAAMAMIDYGFRVLIFAEITAHAMVHNPSSSRVLQKLQFQSVGLIKGACEKKGQTIDADGYMMTRDAWMERANASLA